MPRPLINITWRHACIFAVFLVGYEFLTYIANDMIMPAMIDVVASFHAPETAIASSLTAYLLGGASLQLLLGPLSDRYGRRPVMISGAVLFFLCTVFIACSHSIDQFLIARLLQGMGLCFIGVVGYATLQEIFAEMDAVRLISIMSNVSILAPLLGPVLGAVCIHYVSWRMIFASIAACALITLWGLWRFMPESVGQLKHDGLRIEVASLSPATIARNYKHLLVNRAFLFGSIAGGLLSLPCVAWIGLAPVILVLDAKLSMIEYGLWQIPIFAACILGNVVLQRMTHICTIKQLCWIGSTLAVAGLLLTACLPYMLQDRYLWLMPGLMLYFFGYGFTGAPFNRFLLFSTPVSKGTASALISMLTMAIQGVGIEVVNQLYVLHSNTLFGVCCAIIGGLYALFFMIAFIKYQKG
jgi:DHA1 family multidrug/chloramphenicol efflux transport protein-like MFS transporter